MRSRISLLAFVLVASSFVFPHLAHAGGIPFFGPIIPDTANTCPAGWGLLIIVINNIISLLITLAIVFVAPIMIAYSGFLFVVNPVNPTGKAKARGILLNTIVGIVIALASWLIVDAIMAVLYNGSFGTWSSLITSGGAPICLSQAGSTSAPTPSSGVTTVAGNIGVAGALCASGNPACSVSALEAQGLTSAQASAMSCIAVTESSGNPNTPDSSTGACGTFQITTRPGNWSNPAYHSAPCSTSSSCNDATCNLQTAVIMFKKQGYQPWTGKNPDGTYWNPNAVACVNKYDPGN